MLFRSLEVELEVEDGGDAELPDDPRVVGDDDVLRIERALDVVEGPERLAGPRTTHLDGAREGVEVEGVQRLPEQQRVAVILSYHENMSNGEIAEVMDTTVAAVESLLKRGRQQLREMLKRHERDLRGAFTDC